MVALLFTAVAPNTALSKTRQNRLKDAKKYRFDGFSLGDSFHKVMAKTPYKNPCDDDPVDKRTHRAMVYGGLPCRGRTFPQNTTVVFLLKLSPGTRRNYRSPIKAFAYLGGRYFASKSTFPIHPGDSTKKAKRLLGVPRWIGTLGRRHVLKIWKYRHHVRLLVSGDKVAGVVMGPMPSDMGNEQWKVISSMYRRYTPKAPIKRAAKLCASIWKKVWRCRNKNTLAKRMAKDRKGFSQKCRQRLRTYPTIMKCIARSSCQTMTSCLPPGR